jgi:uncharacterized protein (UPF0254 family)
LTASLRSSVATYCEEPSKRVARMMNRSLKKIPV